MRRYPCLGLLLFLVSLPLLGEERIAILTKNLPVQELPAPYNWGHQEAGKVATPLDFHIDLDLLAPLGSRDGNAALYFRHFTKSDGSRFAELQGVDVVSGGVGARYPSDHEIVREAERAIEQRRMSFYPDVFRLQGPETPIANLLHLMRLGRTWIDRGQHAESPAEALDDFRRAIRLGRLLRQDDTVVIQDLIGLALIRMGAEAIYELARRQNDPTAMLVAALAVQDVSGIRLRTQLRIRSLPWSELNEQAPLLSLERWFGKEIDPEDFEAAKELATASADVRFRHEGIVALEMIVRGGESKYRNQAREVLRSVKANDPHPLVREHASLYIVED